MLALMDADAKLTEDSNRLQVHIPLGVYRGIMEEI